MAAWYASLAEWQRWVLAVLCVPLIPFVAALVLFSFPFCLLACMARDELDRAFEAEPPCGKGRG